MSAAALVACPDGRIAPAMARPAARSDHALLQAGDPDAFAEFYRRHVDWVLGYLQRRLRDPELAFDVCSEVFASALLARRRFRPRDASGAANVWLLRIAHNKLVDAVRAGKAADAARERLQLERVDLEDADLREIERLAEGPAVQALLSDLPEEQRDAVTARVLEEREYGEIAGDLAVSEAVVRKRVSRGLSGLRRRLGGEERR